MATDPTDWPSEFRELQEIEDLLKCAICYEYINTAVMAPKCSHTFCSLCIRRYLSYKTQCPTCSTALAEPELVINRAIDNILLQFRKARSKLLHALKNQTTGPPDTAAGSTSSCSDLPFTPKRPLEKLSSGTTATDKSTPKPSCKGGKLNFQKLTKKFQEDKKEKDASDDDFTSKTSTRRPLRHKSKPKYVDSGSDSDGEDSDVVICEAGGDVAVKTSHVSSSFESPARAVASTSKDELQIPSATMQRLKSPSLPTLSDSDHKMPNLGSPSLPTMHRTSGMSSHLRSPTMPTSSASPSVSRASSMTSSVSSSQSSSSSASSSVPTVVRVPCPVCGVEVPQRNINLHLDSCLKGGDKCPAPPPPPRRKALPKLVYTLMSEKELRKKLLDAGLPTLGDRKAMIERHREYTLMYNSQCDSLNPKSAAEIAKEIKKAEENRNKVSSSNSLKTKFFVAKGATSTDVEKAQDSYVSQHKDQFKQLIADVRRRQMLAKQKKAQEIAAKSSDNTSTESSKPVDSRETEPSESDNIKTVEPSVNGRETSASESGVGESTSLRTVSQSLDCLDSASSAVVCDNVVDRTSDNTDIIENATSNSSPQHSTSAYFVNSDNKLSSQIVNKAASCDREVASDVSCAPELSKYTSETSSVGAAAEMPVLNKEVLSEHSAGLSFKEHGYDRLENDVDPSPSPLSDYLASVAAEGAVNGVHDEDDTQTMDYDDEDEDAFPPPSQSPAVRRPVKLVSNEASDELFPSLSSNHDDSDSDASDILVDLSMVVPAENKSVNQQALDEALIGTDEIPTNERPGTPASKVPALSHQSPDTPVMQSTSPVFEKKQRRKRRRSKDKDAATGTSAKKLKKSAEADAKKSMTFHPPGEPANSNKRFDNHIVLQHTKKDVSIEPVNGSADSDFAPKRQLRKRKTKS